METNGSGGRFPWRLGWLNQAQAPAHWQKTDRDEANRAFDLAALLDLHSTTLLEETNDRSMDGDAALVETAGLAELTQIAEEVARLIQPAHPSPLFRAQLKAALLTTHSQNRAQRTLFQQVGDPSLWPWQVIATVPVLIGVAALIWRHTHRSAEAPAEVA